MRRIYLVIVATILLVAAACSSTSDEDTATEASPSSASSTEESPSSDGGDTTGETSASAESADYVLPEPYDRGITADQVHIGVFTLDLTVGDAIGADLGKDEDDSGYAAFVRELNEAGGIGGREVVLHTYEFSPIDANQQRSKCIEATQDDGIFLALVTVGYDGESISCLTEQNNTLTISGDGLPAAYYDRANGLLFSSAPTEERMYTEWARQLDAIGELDGKTVGVVSEDSLKVLDAVQNGLMPELERLGHDDVELVVLPCEGDLYSPCTQHESAVEKFKQQGVDAVFSALTATANPAFVDAAANANFTPQYYVNALNVAPTIFHLLTGDETRRQAWDGTLAVTAGANLKMSPDDPSTAPSDAALECTDRYEALTGERVEFDPNAVDNDNFGLMAAQCLLISLVGDVGNSIPADELNARTFSKALQDSGVQDTSPRGAPPTMWEPGRFDADRSVSITRYDAACDCFLSVDGEHHEITS